MQNTGASEERKNIHRMFDRKIFDDEPKELFISENFAVERFWMMCSKKTPQKIYAFR